MIETRLLQQYNCKERCSSYKFPLVCNSSSLKASVENAFSDWQRFYSQTVMQVTKGIKNVYSQYCPQPKSSHAVDVSVWGSKRSTRSPSGSQNHAKRRFQWFSRRGSIRPLASVRCVTASSGESTQRLILAASCHAKVPCVLPGKTENGPVRTAGPVKRRAPVAIQAPQVLRMRGL